MIFQVQTIRASIGPTVQNIWKECGLLVLFLIRVNGINVL